MSNLLAKLSEVAGNFSDIEKKLSEPDIVNNLAEYTALLKKRSELEPIVEKYHQLNEAYTTIEESKEMLNDPDESMVEFARDELKSAEALIEELEPEIRLMLVPPDPNDDKNIIIEIRAGTGGDEAAIFAGDLYRMYTRYADLLGWKIEPITFNSSESGGYKEVTFNVSGNKVFSKMKYESGTHRVQRVPTTETQGRVHTSAVTVAVLPEAEEVDVQIRQEDLKIDVYRSGGPGGQSVNTTDSAVRITHLPTNTVVAIQDEKSQHKNRDKAMKILRARIYEAELAKQNAEISAERRAMVGTGDRSQRIRTYNYPQNRLTDHRINLTLYSLDKVVEGLLDDLINALITHDRTEQLKSVESA